MNTAVLTTTCDRMQAVSDRFYREAIQTGNHAFIEFAGLMNEYIMVCRKAAASGIDFTMASIHTERPLPFREHHLRYLQEKLSCIYGPSVAEILRARMAGAADD